MPVTLLVSKPDKSSVTKDLQPANILAMLVASLVSMLFMPSIVSNEPIPLNRLTSDSFNAIIFPDIITFFISFW